ncbi:Uncharacterised protein [Burkholderia pseudomallei]|uniref:Uncharacterized protein n=2 Tax=Burkholderia pseudomallei TaxID=28450 RepID=A0AAX0UBE0_BURPE|nr:hypothetical protein [Burkholderia pseudomallei]ABN91593.1 hypothetical protein BURPS1106A_1594 [Burkholderia pseudomallei 1106a]AFR15516.1 hypothetical protein BPC006_I1640 [Burkholderia pseudomallei BPC006]AIO14657.1 hypothetical protein DP58_157 [Burkholderia pseudomallei]AIO90570.1 hypothetical protein DP48_2048 [Burkholderia pseudomallei]AIS87119.1 hypothetical protein BBU_774 [Burkholderia pseudomallei NAU35A-3]
MQLRTLLLALAIVAIAVATTYYIVTVDTDTPFAATEPAASAAGASEPTARLIAPGDGAPSTPIARDDAQSPLPDAWK